MAGFARPGVHVVQELPVQASRVLVEIQAVLRGQQRPKQYRDPSLVINRVESVQAFAELILPHGQRNGDLVFPQRAHQARIDEILEGGVRCRHETKGRLRSLPRGKAREHRSQGCARKRQGNR